MHSMPAPDKHVQSSCKSSSACRERWLILSYFGANDTILLFEPPKNNSGVVGGKYLERSIVCKPKSSEQFTDKCGPTLSGCPGVAPDLTVTRHDSIV